MTDRTEDPMTTPGRFPQSEEFHRLQSMALHARHKDGSQVVSVFVADVLAVCNECKGRRRAAKKYKWLYRRLRNHWRAMQREMGNA